MICPSIRAGALVVLLLQTIPQPTMAADYFVATTGNDANPGSESQPFQTIRRGIAAATTPGDTVYIRGGSYGGGWDNQLNPTFSGSAGSPITFKAYPGELPILDGSALAGSGASGVEPNSQAVSFVRVEGLVAQNWDTSGFSNGWNYPSSNMEFINCVAENNGVNGIAFYKASNVRIEGSIAAHNGALEPSWSSGINIFEAAGNNIISRNVSFENIDVSSNRSDGSGFILDEGSTHGLFINNIAFRNGGSCIRLTSSSGASLINNTCVLNGQDSNVDYNDEVYVSDSQSTQGASLINNVFLPGQAALGGQTIANATNNVTLANGSSFVSSSGSLDFHLSAAATQLIDQGQSSGAPANDIGFDPQCISQASGLGRFWAYAPDYAYIESVGGVAGCFRPGARPEGGGYDIGAYEAGATATSCAGNAECDDGNACTTDTCGASGQCSNLPIENCCSVDSDCSDDDVCTVDSCNLQAGLCENVVDPECGENPSGDWTVNDTTGYVSVCDWGGFAWSNAGPAEAGVNGTVSSIEETAQLCYSGVVAAHDGYSGYAMLGVNLNQVQGADTVAESIAPTGDGLNISITNNSNAALRVQIQDALGGDDATHRWCVEVDGSGGFYPWSQFNTECWTGEGIAYALEPINVIAIMVAGHNTDDVSFDFCLNQFSPSGTECAGEIDPTTTSSTGSTTTTAGTGTSAGASTTGGATTGGIITETTCQVPLTLCGQSCVNVASDALNCGGCSIACPAGSVCSAGTCTSSCASGLTQCGQSCVAPASDILNCGACNTRCQTGQTCSNGVCTGEATGGDVSMPTNVTTSPSTTAAQKSNCACSVVGASSAGRVSVLATGALLVLAFRRRGRQLKLARTRR